MFNLDFKRRIKNITEYEKTKQLVTFFIERNSKKFNALSFFFLKTHRE
jgi:hypothetical protein